jgi:hypothetical protein
MHEVLRSYLVYALIAETHHCAHCGLSVWLHKVMMAFEV